MRRYRLERPFEIRARSDDFLIVGSGHGHGVGMSQWGAQAMALAGSGFAEILGHYYGGLVPQPADDLIPTGVAVGLAWRQEKVVVRSSGAFE